MGQAMVRRISSGFYSQDWNEIRVRGYCLTKGGHQDAVLFLEKVPIPTTRLLGA